MKISVRHNVWGNWNCYIGSTQVDKFGERIDAMLWLANTFLTGNYTVSDKSYITMSDLQLWLVDHIDCIELKGK